jgi:hypothetical protein
MAHGDDAAARLNELSTYFRQHPIQGAAGHSYISSEPRATAVTPTLPFNAGVVDHITASVKEVAEHTLAANPDAGPLPARVRDAYKWMHDSLQHAPEVDQVRADAIEYRQYLEHCLEERDHETVRKEIRTLPCPKCGCWGLMWARELREAVCTNTECVDKDGFSTTLSLGRIAHARAVARQNVRQARAT